VFVTQPSFDIRWLSTLSTMYDSAESQSLGPRDIIRHNSQPNPNIYVLFLIEDYCNGMKDVGLALFFRYSLLGNYRRLCQALNVIGNMYHQNDA